MGNGRVALFWIHVLGLSSGAIPRRTNNVVPRHVGVKKEAFEIEPMRQSTLIHLLPIYTCFLLQIFLRLCNRLHTTTFVFVEVGLIHSWSRYASK